MVRIVPPNSLARPEFEEWNINVVAWPANSPDLNIIEIFIFIFILKSGLILFVKCMKRGTGTNPLNNVV